MVNSSIKRDGKKYIYDDNNAFKKISWNRKIYKLISTDITTKFQLKRLKVKTIEKLKAKQVKNTRATSKTS